MNLLNEAKLRQLGVSRLSARGMTRLAANAEMLKEARAFTHRGRRAIHLRLLGREPRGYHAARDERNRR